MCAEISTIAFDADDTLWENEQFFRMTQDRFAALLADYTAADHLAERLLAAERRNLGGYGFGIKGFVLSMIETAIEVTDGAVPAKVIKELIEAGQEMLSHPIHLLDGVEATVRAWPPITTSSWSQRAICSIRNANLRNLDWVICSMRSRLSPPKHPPFTPIFSPVMAWRQSALLWSEIR